MGISLFLNLIMNKDDVIASMAGASAKNIPARWKFRPSGKFIVNDQDTDSFVGELWYENGEFEIGPAVQVRNWTFCLERRRVETRLEKNLNDDWFVSAFKGQDHFTFNCKVQNKLGSRNPDFMRFVCCTFWPILHPEAFDNLVVVPTEVGAAVAMTFRAEMFKREENTP